MNDYGLTFHHFGLAVKFPDKAVNFLRGLGYEIGHTVRDDLQNVNLIFCSSESMPAVEVIFPTETEGPLTSLLKFNTEMIYHICYETSNLDRTLSAIKSDRNRVICVSPPKTAVLFSERKVSFYKISGLGIVEILEP